jgi:hypothetical protein
MGSFRETRHAIWAYFWSRTRVKIASAAWLYLLQAKRMILSSDNRPDLGAPAYVRTRTGTFLDFGSLVSGPNAPYQIDIHHDRTQIAMANLSIVCSPATFD